MPMVIIRDIEGTEHFVNTHYIKRIIQLKDFTKVRLEDSSYINAYIRAYDLAMYINDTIAVPDKTLRELIKAIIEDKKHREAEEFAEIFKDCKVILDQQKAKPTYRITKKV